LQLDAAVLRPLTAQSFEVAGNKIRGTFALRVAVTGWKSAANSFLCMGRTRTQRVELSIILL